MALLFSSLLAMACAKSAPTESDVVRARPGQLLARGGFIASGQRAKELDTGAHPIRTCGICHTGAFGGPVIDRDCEDCHTEQNQRLNHPRPFPNMCARCHMPFATIQSRITNKYAADLRSHVLRLRTTEDLKESMFVEGGKVIEVGEGLTLDLVCYQCHKDTSDVGGGFSRKTIAELAARASIIHSAGTPVSPTREAE